MTYQHPLNEYAVAPRFEFESFAVFSNGLADSVRLVPPGVCLNPSCSAYFDPARAWQLYCCDACRRVDIAELRRVGLKAAPAMLAWQSGRYSKDADLQALCRAGRNYVSNLQAVWVRDRLNRTKLAGGI